MIAGEIKHFTYRLIHKKFANWNNWHLNNLLNVEQHIFSATNNTHGKNVVGITSSYRDGSIHVEKAGAS